MKKALITMVVMFALIIWPFGGITELILEEIKSLKADITHKNEEC